MENVSRKAQELSLACDGLLVAMRYGDNGKPVPLATGLQSVRKVKIASVVSDVRDVHILHNKVGLPVSALSEAAGAVARSLLSRFSLR